MIKTIDEILKRAADASGRRMAVAAAHDKDVMEGVCEAHRMGIAESVLIGDAGKIEDIVAAEGLSGEFEIIDSSGDTESSRIAVELARTGKVNCIMKGLLATADLMKAVVNKETGIRTERLISHTMFYELSSYPKLLLCTDGGMIPAPNLEQKADILENAAITMKNLAYEHINAACLSGAETVSAKIQSSVDAVKLSEMKERWAKYDMNVIGPVGLDLAISPEACAHKHFSAPGCGEADILLVPTYEVGNAMGKALTYFAGAKSAGIIVGAAVPIVLVSRADNAETKLASIALACIAG